MTSAKNGSHIVSFSFSNLLSDGRDLSLSLSRSFIHAVSSPVDSIIDIIIISILILIIKSGSVVRNEGQRVGRERTEVKGHRRCSAVKWPQSRSVAEEEEERAFCATGGPFNRCSCTSSSTVISVNLRRTVVLAVLPVFFSTLFLFFSLPECHHLILSPAHCVAPLAASRRRREHSLIESENSPFAAMLALEVTIKLEDNFDTEACTNTGRVVVVVVVPTHLDQWWWWRSKFGAAAGGHKMCLCSTSLY